MKYKSIEATKENLKRIFVNSPSADTISLEDAFVGWGRPDPNDIEKNKGWLSSELVHFKYHNLLSPMYSFSNGRRRLVKLQLTLDGKKALGRIQTEQQTEQKIETRMNGNQVPVTFADVTRLVAQFKKNNPEYEVNFDVKLRTNEE
jgi:hypothetical protein